MDVGKLIAEFIELNAKAKGADLSDHEFQRWAELKDALIAAIGSEGTPKPKDANTPPSVVP